MKNNFLPLFDFVLICVFVFVSDLSFGQASAVYQGAFNFGQVAEDVAVDANGNMYVTGSFAGTVDFNPGAGVLNLASSGGTDIFVMKLSATGTLVWAHRFGDTGSETGTSIDVDALGNVYTTGVFQSVVDFDPSAGVATRSGRIFTQKLDTNGNFVWVSATTGTNTLTQAWGTIDNAGNVYRAGHFAGTIDFDPDISIIVSLTSVGTRDIFVEKLDASGNLLWVKQIGGAGTHSGSALALDPSNNVLVTGQFQNSIDFDPGAGTTTLVDQGVTDAYVLMLDGATGNFGWVRQITGTNEEEGTALTTDPSGNIFLGGTFNGTADFDPGAGVFNIVTTGTRTIFAEKLDASGNYLWAKAMQGSSQNNVDGIAIDPLGGVYLTGQFQNTVDFDPNAGVSNLTSNGARDLFLQRLSPSGALAYVHKFGSTSDDAGNALTYLNNFLYMTGSFQGTVDFDPSATSVNLTADAVGVLDGFLLKTSNSILSLTIDPQPQPASICTGANTSFALTVAGTSNITYQWQKFNTALSSFQNVSDNTNYSGSTTNSLAITNATSTFAGDYRCAVSGDFVTSTFSNTVTLTVQPLPSSPTTTPVVSDGCGVQTYNLTASSPTAGEFRWYDKGSGGAPQQRNATGNFTTPALSASETFYVSFFNGVCESLRTPATITMVVDGPGVLDDSFVPVPSTDGWITFMEDFFVQPDNKIVVNSFSVDPDEYYMTRLLPAGGFDPDFQKWDQTLFNGHVDVVELQPNGKIVFAGRFTTINGVNYGRIGRLNADGTLDGTFNSTAPGFNSGAVAMAVQPDGKIIVGGTFTTYNGSAANRIVRLNANGTIDATFNTGSGANDIVEKIFIQDDGKVLIGGNFTIYNSLPVNYMARLNADGSLDNSFTSPGVEPLAMAVQADQKIVIGGNFADVGGVARSNFARLNANGTLDLTFDVGTGFSSEVLSIYVEPSSKIIVGGWFENLNGQSRNFIARVNPDGSVDNFFNAGVGPYSAVYAIHRFSADRVIIGGYIDQWNGELQNGMAVINNECTRTPLGFGNTSCNNSITISACGGSDGQYRWYSDAAIATPIAGETNSTLSITNLLATKTYYVTLKDAVCESNRVPVVATLSPPITLPGVTGSSGCINQTQTLSASGAADGSYRWYQDAVGGTAIIGAVNSTFTTPTLSAQVTYHVSIFDGTCESGRVPVTATITNAPTPGVTPSSVCGNGTVTLGASGGTNGQYRWYTLSVGGTAIVGQTNASFTTPILSSITSYFVSLVTGTCESARIEVVATVNPLPTSPVTTGDTKCSGQSATLSATGATDGNYRWYNSLTGPTPIANQSSGSFGTPVLTATTSFFASVVSGSCESVRVEAIATINALPSSPSVTGDDICSGESAVLSASGTSNGNYRWYSSATAPSPIIDEVNATLITPTLVATTNYFVSSIALGCESPRVQVTAAIVSCGSNQPPVITATQSSTSLGGLVTINLLSLISDEDENLDLSSLEISHQPQSGAIGSIVNGVLTINYQGIMFSGMDVFSVTICDDQQSCTEQEFTIEVVGDILVYNAISPNGDGLNDFFRLEYIDLLPETQRNSVTIFNRWGDVVFGINDYDNDTRVFRGLSDKGNELPSGTYFYKIEFFSGRETKSGYLYLKQ